MATFIQLGDPGREKTPPRFREDLRQRQQPAAVADELHAMLDALGLTQHRIARLFGITPRSFRRWVRGDRRTPRGIIILVRLLRAGVVTIAQVERAAVPARTNGRTKPRPPTPRRVEPEPEQSAVARAEAAAFADLSPVAAAVVALVPGVCRWPEGDPGSPAGGFRFCNDPVAAPPYCARHRAQAYLAPRTGSGHGVRVGFVTHGRHGRPSIPGAFSATGATGASRPPKILFDRAGDLPDSAQPPA
jgi:transcriptional regulator with XRE-family HTH domain